MVCPESSFGFGLSERYDMARSIDENCFLSQTGSCLPAHRTETGAQRLAFGLQPQVVPAVCSLGQAAAAKKQRLRLIQGRCFVNSGTGEKGF